MKELIKKASTIIFCSKITRFYLTNYVQKFFTDVKFDDICVVLKRAVSRNLCGPEKGWWRVRLEKDRLNSFFFSVNPWSRRHESELN